MLRLECAVLVEGKYDKIRLSNIVDAPVFVCDGFQIFKNKEKLALLRAVAEKRGLIILTDSDSAGVFIRNRLKGIIGSEYIKNVYLPAIAGKEKRKNTPSAEGLLGVEGTDDEIIIKALSSFVTDRIPEGRRIERSDLYEWGLIGDGSRERRDALKRKLSLPAALSTTGLLEAVNILYTYEEVKEILDGEN